MISDATALICLSRINKLDILKRVYSAVIIPPAVKNEVLLEEKEGYSIIKSALESGWIKVVEPRKILALGLGAGENQAISLAKERKDNLILDDALAIKAANALDIPIVRTTSVVFTALNKKIISIISKKQALSLLNQLIENGYYISIKNYAVLISELK